MYHTEFGRRLRSQSSNSSLSRNQSHESLLLPSSSDRRDGSGSGGRIGSGLGKRSSLDYTSFASPSTNTTLDDEDPFGGEDIFFQRPSGSRPRTPKLAEKERPRTPGRGRTGIQGDRLVKKNEKLLRSLFTVESNINSTFFYLTGLYLIEMILIFNLPFS